MADIKPGEFRAMADVVRAQLDEDDDAQPEVAHDVEQAPENIPGEVWRDALNSVMRQLAHARAKLLDAQDRPWQNQ